VENVLGVRFLPTHARLFEPRCEDRLARRLGPPAAEGQPLTLVGGIGHVAGVLFEVVARLAKRTGSAAQAAMTAERQGPLHHADGALRFLLRSARGAAATGSPRPGPRCTSARSSGGPLGGASAPLRARSQRSAAASAAAAKNRSAASSNSAIATHHAAVNAGRCLCGRQILQANVANSSWPAVRCTAGHPFPWREQSLDCTIQLPLSAKDAFFSKPSFSRRDACYRRDCTLAALIVVLEPLNASLGTPRQEPSTHSATLGLLRHPAMTHPRAQARHKRL
jgi:hypothetical protein